MSRGFLGADPGRLLAAQNNFDGDGMKVHLGLSCRDGRVGAEPGTPIAIPNPHGGEVVDLELYPRAGTPLERPLVADQCPLLVTQPVAPDAGTEVGG